ncbi:MAG: hypothetical protein DMG79_19255 [Acidobacteria bacterium]|nr:MAG: hypothetical protein DMG79_19255 [Acidobacteriota bacterium]
MISEAQRTGIDMSGKEACLRAHPVPAGNIAHSNKKQILRSFIPTSNLQNKKATGIADGLFGPDCSQCVPR